MLTRLKNVLVSNSYGNYNHFSGSLHSLTFEILLNKMNVSFVINFTYIWRESTSEQVISKVKNTDFYKLVSELTWAFSISK